MAGLEERLSKLESILHRLFCCDTNQFTGPQGPQGPQGETGEPGPPGADGAIIFQNLNWMGEFTPCVIYNQFDAVSYNGSSYFLNCEDSGSFECEYPIDNTCWVLLANAGATGPQGPTGLTGNDGSNSGRWKFKGVSTPQDPGSTWFTTDTVSLSLLSEICVSTNDINTTSYLDWWQALRDFMFDHNPLTFIQITEVGSNNVIGIYQIDVKGGIPQITMYPTYVNIALTPVYVSNNSFTDNKTYTISWSLHGGVTGTTGTKTKGEVLAELIPAPFPVLQYDFNEAYSDNPWTPAPFPAPQLLYYVALPTPTVRGQELFIVAKGDYEFGVITHDGSSTMLLFGTDELTDEFVIWPKDVYRATWDGDYWIMEIIQGQPSRFNYYRAVSDKFELQETIYNPIVSPYPTAASLNTTYPSTDYAIGLKVYMSNIPGGPRCFVKVSDTEWQSFSTGTVI